MVFLTSPNNPDGSMIEEADLLALLALPALVILDEAYIEFSTVTPSSRLLVLHTEAVYHEHLSTQQTSWKKLWRIVNMISCTTVSWRGRN